MVAVNMGITLAYGQIFGCLSILSISSCGTEDLVVSEIAGSKLTVVNSFFFAGVNMVFEIFHSFRKRKISNSFSSNILRKPLTFMDHAKKAAEERILKKFVSNKELGLIISTIQPLEPPDFKMKRYIKDEFKNIGVELTQVINPSLKQYESTQKAIVKMAHETFKSVLSDKLTVYVDFSRATFPLDRSSLRSLSESLAKIVTDVTLKNKGFLFHVETDEVDLPVEFDKITIEKNDDHFENWQRFGSFAVPYVDENWFAEIIKRKEGRIPNYSETFDEKWLVMVANFGSASSHFQFTSLK